MKRTALAAVAIALALPAFGQGTSLQDVVAGRDAPLSMKLKDLNSDWKRVTIGSGGGSGLGDLMSQIMPLAMMGASGGKSSNDMMGMAVMSSMFGGGGGSQPAYYSKGQTTTIGGETFLVAYKYEKPEINFMQLMMESEQNGGKEPDFSKLLAGIKLTPDSPLTLSLVNVRSINTLSGIRPFDLNQEIADSAKGPGGLLEMLVSQSKAAPAQPAVATPVPVQPAKPKAKKP